jgi:hypothetical protein
MGRGTRRDDSDGLRKAASCRANTLLLFRRFLNLFSESAVDPRDAQRLDRLSETWLGRLKSAEVPTLYCAQILINQLGYTTTPTSH